MNGNSADLDNKIKSKFKLFSGVRSQDEDQKIYDKVYDLCFDEMIAFLGENLDESENAKFFEELDKQTSEEKKVEVLLTTLTKTLESKKLLSQLNQKLDTFLDKLLVSSLSNLKNK